MNGASLFHKKVEHLLDFIWTLLFYPIYMTGHFPVFLIDLHRPVNIALALMPVLLHIQ